MKTTDKWGALGHAQLLTQRYTVHPSPTMAGLGIPMVGRATVKDKSLQKDKIAFARKRSTVLTNIHIFTRTKPYRTSTVLGCSSVAKRLLLRPWLQSPELQKRKSKKRTPVSCKSSSSCKMGSVSSTSTSLLLGYGKRFRISQHKACKLWTLLHFEAIPSVLISPCSRHPDATP